MEQKKKSQIFTIPNLLSLFRLCLIPLFVWLYCWRQSYMLTACVLILSGLTDLADGYIARRFNMTSDLGKALDPVADKLTQATMMLCLLTRFRLMLIPLSIIVIKELVTGVFSLVVIKKTGRVMSADWHGKLTTLLLYAMMIIHVLWYDIPYTWSTLTILACIWMMLLSFCLYIIRNINALREAGRGDEKDNKE
ncbi:MAG: CDP-alcohol phosphatidyltransferase family protein [Oscillospiraceae bacterium]|nr:CDP-alcohol phosphatidyltransferase family protein [Oscillospiraceae bacterium]